MSLNFTKLTYVDGETVIPASNLNEIQEALLDLDSNKVEKEQGKGLSTNDYTNEEKAKVAAAAPASALDDYRTAAAQDTIDAAQDERIDAAAQATSSSTLGPAPIVTFDASAADMPLKGLTVNIEPVQDLHGYDHPWPGGGGKNLLENMMQSQTISGVTITVNDDGSFKTSGTAQANISLALYSKRSIADLVGGNIVISGCPANGSKNTYCINLYYHNSTGGTIDTATQVETGNGLSVNVPANAVDVSIALTISLGTNVSNLIWYPMLRLSSTDASYAPYSNICPISGWTGCNIVLSPTLNAQDGTTYPITFPTSAGTVYGGTLDVVNGKLTVDRAFLALNTAQWSYVGASGAERFYTGALINSALYPATLSTVPELISSKYRTVTQAAYASSDDVITLTTTGSLVIRDTSYTDVTSFVDSLADATLVYRLANPIVYDLTGIPEITTLLGTNNIWADTGDVTVTYGAYLEMLKASLNRTNGELDALRKSLRVIYGFHIDADESDPVEKVTYLADAVGMTPAAMDFANGVFNWGSWRDAFFMPRPCMLKYDGTVDYYLDPDDYTKKYEGGASDVADVNYGGNAMMEWGQNGKKIWYKIVPDADPTGASIYIADHQADANFHAYPFINNQGVMVDHFYTPIYNGTLDESGKLRSISGIAGTSLCKSKTAAQEIAAAELNNPGTDKLWDTEVYADILVIQLLLTLISKRLDSNVAFGEGLISSGSESVNNGFTTGVHNDKGLFYGTNSGAAATYTNAVKAFGMENFWGFQWRRFRGLVNVSGTEKYKLTRGTQDGSTAQDYVVSTAGADYDGYLTGGALPAASGTYIDKMTFDTKAMTPTAASGNATTNYCDGLWTNNDQCDYAFRGGSSHNGARCGLWCFDLASTASSANWHIGAALSCKPLS